VEPPAEASPTTHTTNAILPIGLTGILLSSVAGAVLHNRMGR
jgi:hypothetical protein